MGTPDPGKVQCCCLKFIFRVEGIAMTGQLAPNKHTGQTGQKLGWKEARDKALGAKAYCHRII